MIWLLRRWMEILVSAFCYYYFIIFDSIAHLPNEIRSFFMTRAPHRSNEQQPGENPINQAQITARYGSPTSWKTFFPLSPTTVSPIPIPHSARVQLICPPSVKKHLFQVSIFDRSIGLDDRPIDRSIGWLPREPKIYCGTKSPHIWNVERVIGSTFGRDGVVSDRLCWGGS